MQLAFSALESELEFFRELERFQMEHASPIPVWVGSRTDLSESVDLANTLYEGVIEPSQADFGVLLSDLRGIGSCLIDPLAQRWTTRSEARTLAEEGRSIKILIVGIYQDLNWSYMRNLILQSYSVPAINLSFLTGRDLHSLLWLVAKQWAGVKSEVEEIGFFSSVDSPKGDSPVRVYSEDEFESEDIQSIILNQAWRQILFQGHGKDDNINLGEFTICGRNEAIAAQSDALYPRCGYGWPCFKDEDKLVSLRQLRAIEVVLSACNSAPLPGLGLYDPKYLLLLNAIDGCAQTITGAISVQDSDFPENHLWLEHLSKGGEKSTSILNQSLHFQHPYPAFWHFGTHGSSEADAPEKLLPEDEDIRSCISRLHSYLSSNLIPPNYPLLPRLQKFNRKANLYLSRSRRYADKRGLENNTLSLRSDLQSLDFALVQRITSCPEDDIMNFGSYYGARSELDSKSIREVPCSCGHPAQEFQRQGLLHTVLTTTYVFCLRCGDKIFRLAGAPKLECTCENTISVGQSLLINAVVDFTESGPAHVGLFVPSYLREYTTVTPNVRRIKGRAGQQRELEFTLEFDASVPAQAYYFTIFAVQNLGLSSYRQHFGIAKRVESDLGTFK